MNSRPALVAALAAAAVLTAYLPPHPPAERLYYGGGWDNYPTPESRLAARLGVEYRRARERMETRQLRDSLMRELGSHRRSDDSVVALGSGARLDRAARTLVRTALPPLPARSDEVRAAFVLITAPIYSLDEHVYLPLGTDGRTCISVLTIASADTGLRGDLRNLVRPGDALGPCAFFAAFGLPGPEVRRWLESRSYDVAWKPDWTLRPHAPEPVEKTTAARWFQGTLSRLSGTPMASMEYLGYGGLYFESSHLVGCAAGEIASCRRYVFSPLPGEVRSNMPGVVQGSPYIDYAADRILATLMREQGPERFARFWRSPLPPEKAFDASFTVPFAVWAPAWARATVGPVDVGVSTRPRVILSTLFWIGLSVAGCAGLALARRVT